VAKRREPEEQKELTAIQEQAVMMLAGGATVTATAEALNISRQTVSTWANQDAAFMAVLNLTRAEALDAGADRVRGLVAKALDAVEAAFEAEDMTAKERAALGMEIIKQVRLTEAAGKLGSTNPAAIRQRQAREMMMNAGY
jgi:hypothetical protein